MAGTVLFFALFFYARYDAVNDVSRPNDFHEVVFNNFISICNTDRNEYTPKLKGTKKCNSEKWEI
ncbi:MAG: hypothetical protein J5965_08370 [Aeriscardovia sp.]|nr:hypothetical protein [Aeriscardovia sp.]